MANFVLAYKGRTSQPATEAEGQAAMAAWMAWFGSIGSAVVDHGNPFGPSKTVSNGGTVGDGAASGLSGYSIVSASDLAAATEFAKGCPILANGGAVEVYEVHPLM
jgi:hypothetical protein